MLNSWGGPDLWGAPQTNLPNAEDQFNEGIQLLGRGRFTEAVAAFNRFKQTAPQDPRPYFYSGMALAQMEELSAAALELQEAVRLDPHQPEYVVYQASVLARLKQKDAALTALALFQKEDQVKQLTAAWLQLLAEAYLRLEKFDDALNILGLWAASDPEDPRIYFDRGKVYIALGRMDPALESFKKSVEKSTDNPEAYFELGKLLYQRNALVEAKRALREAVKRDSANPQYLYKLGVICLAGDEVEEGLEYLRRVEPSASVFPEIYFALGRAYQRKGDRIKGDEYRKKFQEATSGHREKEDRNRIADRFISQGVRQLDQGNEAEARNLFEGAVQADPNRWDPHAYLAEMFLSSGDLELAYPHLVKMEEIDPASVLGNYLMAKYWYQRKAFERARVYAEKVKASRPANSELRNLLGSIYIALGQREKAVQEFQAAVRLAPDRSDFLEDLRRAEKQKLESSQNPQE